MATRHLALLSPWLFFWRRFLTSLAGVNLDLHTLARLYQKGDVTLNYVLAEIQNRMERSKDLAIWICQVSPEALRNQGDVLMRRRANGEKLPLFGVPFAVKDNIDVAGLPTTAGCPAFAYTPVKTAPVVERLQKAGALLIGKTNMDQFASGLAGDRSPYGVCRNFFSHDHISGGSSSGSALAVAAGLVTFALGTDTAGSGRVPAGCNNIVGLKPTRDLLSTEGLVPAVRSLDCVSFFAANVSDVKRVFEIAADQTVQDEALSEFTFAVPRPEGLEFYGDNEQAKLFAAAVERLTKMGGRCHAIDFGPLRQVASLLYDGPWLAERLAGLEGFLKEHADDVYPVTRAVLRNGCASPG